MRRLVASRLLEGGRGRRLPRLGPRAPRGHPDGGAGPAAGGRVDRIRDGSAARLLRPIRRLPGRGRPEQAWSVSRGNALVLFFGGRGDVELLELLGVGVAGGVGNEIG